MHYSEYKTGPIYIRSSDHGHMKMGCRGVRGRVMWLPPSFGDRVEHGERLLTVVRGISLCAWFVKWVTWSLGTGASTGSATDGLSDRRVRACDWEGLSDQTLRQGTATGW